MQIEGAHNALEILVAFAAEEFNAEPVWARMGTGRGDRWGNAGDNVEGRGHECLVYAGLAVGTNRRAELQGLTGRADEVAEDGDVGTVRADAACVYGKAETFGEIEIYARIIEF